MANQALKPKINEKSKQGEEGKGLGLLLVSFATSTTAHGLNRIAGSTDFRIRVCWFIVWLGVMIGFVVMIVKLGILYTSKPVSTSISISYHESLTFPGVTICNLNMVPKSRVNSMTKNSTPIMDIPRTMSTLKKDYFSTTQASLANMNQSMLTADPVSSKVMDILTDINNLPIATRMEKGYQLNEFLLSCTWAGIMCTNQSAFGSLYWKQSWNWKYGNCFTFNGYTSINGMTVSPLESSASSGSEGLALVFNINRKEYLTDLTLEEGIRVLIGDQDEPLYPVEKGISIEPGVSASVAIRKNTIQREDTYSNGSCKTTNNLKVKYSVEDCIYNCEAAKQMKLCNCTEAKFSELTTAKICETQTEKTCIILVNGNFSRGLLECRSTCPPPCTSTHFQKTVTQSKVFPAGYLKLYSRQHVPETYVTENIVQLQVFFEDQTVQQISSGVYYKFDNLISDVGGQLGLWIGVSAVTCMEFLALVWNMVVYVIDRRKKNTINFGRD